jgi:hypothetical protein
MGLCYVKSQAQLHHKNITEVCPNGRHNDESFLNSIKQKTPILKGEMKNKNRRVKGQRAKMLR